MPSYTNNRVPPVHKLCLDGTGVKAVLSRDKEIKLSCLCLKTKFSCEQATVHVEPRDDD